MPDLTIQVQEVKGVPGTSLVILNGSIDAKTVITFQTHLNSVKERGVERFILDMENVKYVNSTGLGYLINLSDSVGADRGGISLVKVQPKVKVVFDMLGLNAFFKIFPSREEAFKHLAPTIPGPAAVDQTAVLRSVGAAAPARVPPPPSALTPRAMPAVTPQRPAPPAPVAAPRPAPAPTAVATATPAPVSPAPLAEAVHLECAVCRALLSIRETGAFKCPRCLTMFNYQGGGKANFLPRQKALPVQFSLNFSPECTRGLVQFVKSVASGLGFTPGGMSEVETAVKDTVEMIRRHAYGGNDQNIYHVLMISGDAELELRFADYGASMNSDKGDLFVGVRRLVDRLELKHHPKGGNVVTVGKKAK